MDQGDGSEDLFDVVPSFICINELYLLDYRDIAELISISVRIKKLHSPYLRRSVYPS